MIDLNCDIGEGIGNEASLMPFISSCNISCGWHAGDDYTINRSILLALIHGVAIDAHPSFNDRVNFGRKEMTLTHGELTDLICAQLKKMQDSCRENGATLRHVNPHGALYNMASKSRKISETIIEAVLSVDRSLRLFGLAMSEAAKAAKGKISFIAEGFADNKYELPYKLMSREKGGLLTSAEDIKSQLRRLLIDRQIATANGLSPVTVQSICLHGDTPDAIDLMREIHSLRN